MGVLQVSRTVERNTLLAGNSSVAHENLLKRSCVFPQQLAASIAIVTVVGSSHGVFAQQQTEPSTSQQQAPLPPVVVQKPQPKRTRAPREPQRAVQGTTPRPARATAQQQAPKPAAAAQPAPSPSAAISANLSNEATEAAGYRPDTVSNLGPLGQTPIQEVPYSVSVIPQPLIENQQASIADDIYKIDPLIQEGTPTGRGLSPNPYLRGFLLPNASGRGEDGMAEQTLFAIPLEDKERVEIFTGITSFLYGATNVGGFMNYVLKRPTLTPYVSVTTGDYGGAESYIHGDFGGPITKDGTLAYRLNVLEQGGHGSITQEGMDRNLASGVLTWNINPDAALTVLASHYFQRQNGIEAAFSDPTNPDGSVSFPMPTAPSPSQYYGQPFTSEQTERDRAGADFKMRFNDVFTFRSSYSFAAVEESSNIFPNATFTNSTGGYSEMVSQNPNFYYRGNSGYAFLDSNFFLGPVENKVTTGYYANNYWAGQPPTTFASTTYTGLDLADPMYFPEPTFTPSGASGPVRQSTGNSAQNLVIGDQIKFTPWLEALAGGNYTMLAAQNYTVATGAETSQYDESRLTPAASLIVKPIPQVSIYGTYSQSLQNGQVVMNSGSVIYTNNGTTLSPYVGTEYETGVKATVGGVLLTAAVYQISQALQYAQYNNNGTYTYVQNGQERNRGIELTATGNLLPGLRVLAGLTFIDPRITESVSSPTNPSLNGLIAPDVANVLGKVTGEYDVSFIKGFALTGGVYYTGRQAVDTRNTDWLPAFVTEDLGFRYRLTEWNGQPLSSGKEWIFRFRVSNITNNAYWLTPIYLGEPRTFIASAQLKF